MSEAIDETTQDGRGEAKASARRRGKAEASEMTFECCIPTDPCHQKAERVKGKTAADARERYLRTQGIVSTTHQVQAVQVDDE